MLSQSELYDQSTHAWSSVARITIMKRISYLGQRLKRRDSPLKNGVQNKFRLHNAHRSQTFLDVFYSIYFVAEKTQQGYCSNALHKLLPHVNSQSAILSWIRFDRYCSKNGRTNGMLQSDFCSSCQPRCSRELFDEHQKKAGFHVSSYAFEILEQRA